MSDRSPETTPQADDESDLDFAIRRGDRRRVLVEMLGDHYGGPDYPRHILALRMLDALDRTQEQAR